MKIANNTVVTMDYELRLADDDVIDSDAAFSFLIGHDNIVPGLEAQLLGLSQGDKRDISVEAAQGYGARDEDLVVLVPRSEMPDDFVVEIGIPVELEDEDGETSMAFVAGVEDDHVVLDRNHPLADETLNFRITIGEVRAATAEELTHGHVHGPGGHHH